MRFLTWRTSHDVQVRSSSHHWTHLLRFVPRAGWREEPPSGSRRSYLDGSDNSNDVERLFLSDLFANAEHGDRRGVHGADEAAKARSCATPRRYQIQFDLTASVQ